MYSPVLVWPNSPPLVAVLEELMMGQWGAASTAGFVEAAYMGVGRRQPNSYRKKVCWTAADLVLFVLLIAAYCHNAHKMWNDRDSRESTEDR